MCLHQNLKSFVKMVWFALPEIYAQADFDVRPTDVELTNDSVAEYIREKYYTESARHRGIRPTPGLKTHEYQRYLDEFASLKLVHENEKVRGSEDRAWIERFRTGGVDESLKTGFFYLSTTSTPPRRRYYIHALPAHVPDVMRSLQALIGSSRSSNAKAVGPGAASREDCIVLYAAEGLSEDDLVRAINPSHLRQINMLAMVDVRPGISRGPGVMTSWGVIVSTAIAYAAVTDIMCRRHGIDGLDATVLAEMRQTKEQAEKEGNWTERQYSTVRNKLAEYEKRAERCKTTVSKFVTKPFMTINEKFIYEAVAQRIRDNDVDPMTLNDLVVRSTTEPDAEESSTTRSAPALRAKVAQVLPSRFFGGKPVSRSAHPSGTNPAERQLGVRRSPDAITSPAASVGPPTRPPVGTTTTTTINTPFRPTGAVATPLAGVPPTSGPRSVPAANSTGTTPMARSTTGAPPHGGVPTPFTALASRTSAALSPPSSTPGRGPVSGSSSTASSAGSGQTTHNPLLFELQGNSLFQNRQSKSNGRQGK